MGYQSQIFSCATFSQTGDETKTMGVDLSYFHHTFLLKKYFILQNFLFEFETRLFFMTVLVPSLSSPPPPPHN